MLKHSASSGIYKAIKNDFLNIFKAKENDHYLLISGRMQNTLLHMI